MVIMAKYLCGFGFKTCIPIYCHTIFFFIYRYPKPTEFVTDSTYPVTFFISQFPCSAYICLSLCKTCRNAEYGDPLDSGVNSNAHFDFRTISSAEVTQIGDRYYMLFEGVRGPGLDDAGDTQFGLGLARSMTSEIDGL